MIVQYKYIYAVPVGMVNCIGTSPYRAVWGEHSGILTQQKYGMVCLSPIEHVMLSPIILAPPGTTLFNVERQIVWLGGSDTQIHGC